MSVVNRIEHLVCERNIIGDDDNNVSRSLSFPKNILVECRQFKPIKTMNDGKTTSLHYRSSNKISGEICAPAVLM